MMNLNINEAVEKLRPLLTAHISPRKSRLFVNSGSTLHGEKHFRALSARKIYLLERGSSFSTA